MHCPESMNRMIHTLLYSRRNSSLEMPACWHAALKVELFKKRCPGKVMGVIEPSGLARRRATCSRSRTTSKPRLCKALRTLAFGASTGNFGKTTPWFQQETHPSLDHPAGIPAQKFLDEKSEPNEHPQVRPHKSPLDRSQRLVTQPGRQRSHHRVPQL